MCSPSMVHMAGRWQQARRMRTSIPAALIAVALALTGCGGAPEGKGEGVAVDLDRKLVTLNHDAIPNVSMPAMTMMFAVKDPAAIDQLKAGERVRFTADLVNGTLTLTSVKTDPP